MNRKELYAKVKELNIQKDIIEWYGRDYTKVSNAELGRMIARYSASKAENKHKITSKTTSSNSCKCDKLIEVLKKKHILLDSEVSYINS